MVRNHYESQNNRFTMNYYYVNTNRVYHGKINCSFPRNIEFDGETVVTGNDLVMDIGFLMHIQFAYPDVESALRVVRAYTEEKAEELKHNARLQVKYAVMDDSIIPVVKIGREFHFWHNKLYPITVFSNEICESLDDAIAKLRVCLS